MPTAIVSTMGTSLLTNRADEKLRQMLIRTANARAAELDPADRSTIEALAAERAAVLRDASDQDVRSLSAELNGLLALGPIQRSDCHYLLHSDTFQGEICANLAAGWLTRAGGQPVPVKLDHLTAASPEAFARGVDSLLRWTDQTLREVQDKGWRVIFNLVGGFKALHAYAHTIGMFYADEIVYLFEGPDAKLIRIPRLPLKLDEGSLRQHAAAVARMAAEEILSVDQLQGLPEAYLEVDSDRNALLSDWGQLLWLRGRRDILSGDLLDQPGLCYLDSFKRDYGREQNPDRRVALQEALAKASVLWRRSGLQALRCDGGLLYEDYVNKAGKGHFRISQDIRVSCLPNGTSLEMRHYGSHDYVNNNP